MPSPILSAPIIKLTAVMATKGQRGGIRRRPTSPWRRMHRYCDRSWMLGALSPLCSWAVTRGARRLRLSPDPASASVPTRLYIRVEPEWRLEAGTAGPD